MKKIISVLLCLVFLTTALVSCGGNSVVKPEADRPNLTLRMAIVVDDKTTEEGIAAMQKAFNAECEVNLATHVEFVCIKASEYRATMDEILTGVSTAGKNQSASVEDAMANADGGTVVKDDEYSFPAASAGQFDIVLIADKDMYNDYIEKGWIIGLKSYLGGNFKVLNTKILSTVKDAVYNAEREDYFGIPANKAYGEYTYLVVNEAAATHYGLNPKEDFTSLADAYKLIAAMEAAGTSENGISKWQDAYKEDFSVIRESEEDYVLPNIKYLSTDFSSFSLIGTTYGYADPIEMVPEAANLLKNDEYTRYLATKFTANKNGYFGDGTAENFLVGIEKGDYALRYTREGYYYCPIMYPIMQEEEAFGGMLAVSSFTVDAKRSLEIIQELMTDATGANLLNIALYGERQNNYTLETVDEVNCVSFRNMSNYAAHPDYLFGGLRELAYPCLDYGQNAKTYSSAAQQIVDFGKRKPLFDADFGLYFVTVNATDWATVDAMSVIAYNELMASDDLDDFLANIELLIESLSADEVFSRLEQAGVDDNNASFETLGGAFYKYLRDRASGKLGGPGAVSGEGEGTGTE